MHPLLFLEIKELLKLIQNIKKSIEISNEMIALLRQEQPRNMGQYHNQNSINNEMEKIRLYQNDILSANQIIAQKIQEKILNENFTRKEEEVIALMS